jgi:WXG100 family type VII secretion target
MQGSGELLAKITEMREAANTIGNSANRINEAVDAVDAQVSAIGPDRFSGASADAFRSQYGRLTPQLRQAHEDLLLFKDKLLQSADEIEAASRVQ